jgi:hypothetical protein
VPLIEEDETGRDVVRLLAEHGIAYMRSVERAVAALDLLAPPGPAAPSDDVLDGESGDPLGGIEAAVALMGPHFPWAPMTIVDSADDAGAFAEQIGYPIVLKVAGRTIAHRTEAGGVAVGVTAASLDTDLARIMAVARDAGDKVIAQQLVTDGLELMVSGILDPEAGPIAYVQAGGLLAELVDDRAFVWGGWDVKRRREAIDTSVVGTLLNGYRSGAVYDSDAVAALVDDVLHALASGRLRFLELNPVIAQTDGVVVVDALVRA